MKLLYRISAVIAAAFALFTAGCTKGGVPETDCVISWDARQTFTENGVYYTCCNDENDTILCYYSKENGRSVPVCASPSCTHTSKRSPDCAALVDNIFGFYPSGDRLYYFFNNIDNSSIDLIECSSNGLNRRTVTSVEDVFIPFVKGVRYCSDYVVLAYRIMFEEDKEKVESGLGGDITIELEKPKTVIKKISLSSGDITTLVEKEGYSSSIWGGVIEDDILYYAFSEYTDKIETDPETGEYKGNLTREDVYRYGYYALDTRDGSERKLSGGFDCLAPTAPCFDHFSRDTVCYSTTDDKLYKYNSGSGEFEYLADCYNASSNYACDGREALFLKTPDAENYTRFDLETGAFTDIPRRKCPLGEVSLNGVYIVGSTAWFAYSADDGSYCMGYTDRDEFFNGNFDNAVFAFDINSYSGGSNSFSSETHSQSEDIPQSDSVTLKWGMEKCSITDHETELLNKRLHENGYDFSVEIIQLINEDSIRLEHEFIMDTRNFSELVAEYEAENGALDILTIGSDWWDKSGAGYNLIKDGYFRELTPSDLLLETIPEALWKAAEVNGRLYTIPGQCFNDSGVTYYFNKKFVDESLISDFGGDISELENILKSIAPSENVVIFEYSPDYLDYTSSTPDCDKGGLLLNGKTGKAENPYENADVIEYARTLNLLYKKGYLNYGVNFSELDQDGEVLDKKEVAVMAAPVALDVSLYFPEGSDIAAVTLPSYLENRVSASTGISVKCGDPEAAMEFLEQLRTDKAYCDILGADSADSLLTSFATGLPSERFQKNDEVIPSRFAGFELTYDKITDYTDIASALRRNYDRLCKADDFDSELSAINAELKAAGIDDYTALVNGLLEEYNAGANQ